MAVIPRYISESNVTPAINQTRMDPGTAAAPYKAAEQATAQVLGTLQEELGGWYKVLKTKEAEQAAADAKNRKVADGLYTAEAMAQLAMGSAQIKQKAIASADGTSQVTQGADADFQQLADSVLANAPSDDARINLVKRMIPMRAQLYNNISNESIRVNNQVNMDKIEGILGQYEQHVSTNPADIDTVRQQSADVFASMTELGIPAHVRQKIEAKFNRNLDYQAAASTAEKDPFQMQQAIEAGQLDYLGREAVTKLKSTTNASLKAVTKQAQTALKDVEKRVMAGMPLPQDFEDRAQLAAKAGLTSELQEVVRLVDVSKFTADKTLPELMAASSDLKQMIATGKIEGDPAKVKKVAQLVDMNIKALKKDPFGYAENRGSFKPFNTITDFTNISPEEAQTRSYRALQVQEAYGVESPALKAEEIKILASQMESLPPQEKMKILGNLANFGDTTLAAVTKALDKKDAGLSQAVRMHDIDPTISARILEGRDLLKAKQGQKLTPAELKDIGDSELGDLAVEDPEFKRELLNAGHAYYASSSGAEDARRSIAEANNLIKVNRNGLFTGSYKTIAPAKGMSTEDMDKLVDDGLANAEAWREFGSGIPSRAENGLALPSGKIVPSDYDYVALRNGRYQVMYEGQTVMDDQDRPITVDLKSLNRKINP